MQWVFYRITYDMIYFRKIKFCAATKIILCDTIGRSSNLNLPTQGIDLIIYRAETRMLRKSRNSSSFTNTCCIFLLECARQSWKTVIGWFCARLSANHSNKCKASSIRDHCTRTRIYSSLAATKWFRRNYNYVFNLIRMYER